jgi:dihydropteroate synthase
MKSWGENRIFCTNQTLNFGGRLIEVSNPKIMGILNVTPDSFFDGGKYDSEETILKQAENMLQHGASFIDVGGYSTRPGADDVPPGEESRRVLKAIKAVVKNFPEAILSIDTFRSEVAQAAVQEGALMVNDISGGNQDPLMLKTVAALQVPYIAMHMRGNPKTMNQLVEYDNLIKDIVDYFHNRIQLLHDLGIKYIIIDHGFVFAKKVQKN